MTNKFLRFTDKMVEASSDKVVLDLYIDRKLGQRYTWHHTGMIAPTPESAEERAYIEARAGVYAAGFR